MVDQVYNVVQCSWCSEYFDKVTRKKVTRPVNVTVASHTICDDCKGKMNAELAEMTTNNAPVTK